MAAADPRQEDPPKDDPPPPPSPLDPFIPGYVVVPSAQAAEAAEALGVDPLEIDPTDRQPDSLSAQAFGDRGMDDGDGAALASIAERIAYFALDGADEAETLRLLGELRGAGLDARPYFYCWPFNHWDLQSGEDGRRSVDDDEALKNFGSQVDGSADSWPVYVVDSGYDEHNAWRSGVLSGAELMGQQGGDPAHGTFVAALIAAMAPGASIGVFATDLGHPVSTGFGAQDAATELAVGVQIQKASDHHSSEDDPGPGILNLSLGTYETHVHVQGSAQQLVPLTLDSVLAEIHGELTIVAAGGNDLPHVWNGNIAYPASHRRVFGIGAGDAADAHDPLLWHVWVGAGRTRVHQHVKHHGLKALAPGLDLQAPVGGKDFACWSGSSFAAALYTGFMAAKRGLVPSETKAPYPDALFCEPEGT